MTQARKPSRKSPDWILQSFREDSPDLFVVLDADLRIADCGSTFRRLIGLEDGARVPFEDTVERFSLSKVPPAFDTLRAGKEGHVGLEVFHRTKDGASVAVSYRWMIGMGKQGEILGFVGLGREAVEVAIEHEVRKLQTEVEAARTEADRRGRDAARLMRQMEDQAVHDQLTGLANRRHILERLEQEVARAIRYDEPLSLLLVDIDGLNRVNEDHGRTHGDDVIRRVAEVIKEQVRGSDIASRFEGGQFLILSPHTDRPSAQFLAERLRRRVCEVAFAGNEGDFGVTISVGIVSVAGQNEFDMDAILAAVEQALEAAKTGGRNRVQLCEVQ